MGYSRCRPRLPSRHGAAGGGAFVVWVACVVVLAACDIGRGTAPGAHAPQAPMRFIVADSDTTKRTYTPERCTDPMGGTDNHCAWVIPIAPDEVTMMWAALDQTTCPDVQRIMNSQMTHGRIQKMDLQAARSDPYIFGLSHRYLDPAHLDWSRMHLDARNAFTGQGAVSMTMRHEVLHYLHPEITNEDRLDEMAGACGPH
jgi:hypothetical protein